MSADPTREEQGATAGRVEALPGKGDAALSVASRRALEIEDLLELLASFAATDRGGERVRAQDLAIDRELLERRREEHREAVSVLALAGRLVPSREEPLAPWLDSLESPIAGLDPVDLLAVAEVLEIALAAAARFAEASARAERASHAVLWPARFDTALSPAGDEVSPQDLVSSVRSVLDERGSVRPDASPQLVRLIGGARSRRNRLQEQFASYVERHREQLGEETVALRDGRYSVLLPSGSRGRLAGVVQGRSGTGRSFYFEPLELVEGNNEMATANAAVEAEKARLVRELQAEVRASRGLVARAVDLVAELDRHQAIADFARVAEARLPEIGDGPLVISEGRHPLLDPRLAAARSAALGEPGNQRPVVPLDVDFGEQRMLVVTGPNAGGKTVALKTVGLLVYMAMSGLPIPAASGTHLPRCTKLVALVGDEQDLLTDRSTFSGRLLRLAEAWNAADPGALILVDEIGSGTSPQEGAALGVTLLEELVASGALGVLTTHHIEIASAAMSLPGARSMVMEFDAERSVPTFHLEEGPPAASEALGLARRLGLPARWLDRAERRLSREHQDLRALIAETEALRRQLREERAALESRLRDLAEQEQRLEAELAAARAAREDLRLRVESEVAQYRRQVRSRLASEIDRLGSELKTARRRKVVERAAERVLREAPKVAAPAPAESDRESGRRALEVGAPVRHRSLGWRGVLESLEGDRAMVGVRGKRVRCRAAELVAEDLGPASASPKRRSPVAVASGDLSAEINLVGERVEPAIERLDGYLDRALLSGLERLRVIHGHGSGRLRAALRDHLGHHPAVSKVTAAGQGEGGDGATIVILR